MKNIPVPRHFKSIKMSIDWDINQIIKELEKRSVEHSLDLSLKDNSVSFNIRFRNKDKALIRALLDSLF